MVMVAGWLQCESIRIQYWILWDSSFLLNDVSFRKRGTGHLHLCFKKREKIPSGLASINISFHGRHIPWPFSASPFLLQVLPFFNSFPLKQGEDFGGSSKRKKKKEKKKEQNRTEQKGEMGCAWLPVCHT